ncbi:M23 family metallopeptidase [Pedobacter sp. MR22-3]|uniref:M23 family metallopeptidase n=1 Tax=Pedobacter sp. MR22-3 TaxID=2994552 RepID=UPI002247B925|nr:M23 family metallopeptidase [Pedobacter sp. MR22-3]MCX2584292.1 M23 family metallopeptidase [Pedobacter sp. MR22-3]
MPLNSMKVNSAFGNRIHPVTHQKDFHRGIDLRARNEPVFSFFAGKVSQAGFNPILGKFIRIDHSGVESIYGHLSVILVQKGEEIRSGEVIGVTGSTGRVTGEHLHFSLRLGGVYIDPVNFILRYYKAASTNQINFMENSAYLTLRQKLEMLAIVEEVELNQDEAWVYGIGFADMEEEQDG